MQEFCIKWEWIELVVCVYMSCGLLIFHVENQIKWKGFSEQTEKQEKKWTIEETAKNSDNIQIEKKNQIYKWFNVESILMCVPWKKRFTKCNRPIFFSCIAKCDAMKSTNYLKALTSSHYISEDIIIITLMNAQTHSGILPHWTPFQRWEMCART